MIISIRDSVISRIIWGLIGLHMLNVSVDVADPYSNNVKEDLSINDQESIIELITEKIFGIEHAFAEYDDHDTNEQNKKSTTKIDLAVIDSDIPEFQLSALHLPKSDFTPPSFRLIQGIIGIESPPPQNRC